MKIPSKSESYNFWIIGSIPQRIRPISILKKIQSLSRTRTDIHFLAIIRNEKKKKPCRSYPRSRIKPSGVGSMTDHAYSLRTVWEVKLWRQRVIDNVERRADHYVWMFEGKQAAINSGVHRGCSSRRGMTSSGRCAQNAPARLSSVSPPLSLSLFVPRPCVFVYTSESKGSSQKARYTRKWGEMEIREREREKGRSLLPAQASIGISQRHRRFGIVGAKGRGRERETMKRRRRRR